MIPKIIHYCWFSNPPEYPPEVLKCISSWKEKIPDYEIKLWNAENFDVTICPYVQEAFQEKKYAFASDYVRLWALYNYGGIYLDSDIEVLKSFDDLLINKAFTGFEDKKRIAAWIFGSEKGNPLFKQFMNDYEGRHFIIGEGLYDTTPNPVPITKRLLEHGLKLNGKTQKLDLITVYSETYFCPFNPYRQTGNCFTDNTYSNHYFNGAWKNTQSEKERIYKEREEKYVKVFGRKIGTRVCSLISGLKYLGFKEWIKYLKDTIRRYMDDIRYTGMRKWIRIHIFNRRN